MQANTLPSVTEKVFLLHVRCSFDRIVTHPMAYPNSFLSEKEVQTKDAVLDTLLKCL